MEIFIKPSHRDYHYGNLKQAIRVQIGGKKRLNDSGLGFANDWLERTVKRSTIEEAHWLCDLDLAPRRTNPVLEREKSNADRRPSDMIFGMTSTLNHNFGRP